MRLRAFGRPRLIPGGALHIRDQLHLVPGKLSEGQADHDIFPPVPCPMIDPRGDLDDRNSRWQNRQTAMLARTCPGPAGARGTPGRALGRCGTIYTKPSYSPLDVALAASCILRLAKARQTTTFSLSVWPRSWRTGRNTRHHWALACRTGRTSRRPAARHIVPAPCHAVPRVTVRTPCPLQRVDVRHSACTCERPAVPDRAACSCRAQTRGTVPGLCRRIVCQPPWPSRILRARPCPAFRRNAGTKCDRARASPSRTSDTCRGRSARR